MHIQFINDREVMKKNKVTVVTVCYNAVNIIEKTILSVINQTYSNIEYIIIDGDSKDGTQDIIRKYSDRISYFISEPDKGIFDAMNKGLNVATGDYINFMNAGDLFFDSHVLTTVFAEKTYNENVGFIFGLSVTPDGIVHKYVPFMENPNRYKGMGICHQSLFVKTELAQKYKFSLRYPVSADYGMIYSIYKDGYKYVKYDFPICIYEGGGFSERNPWMMIRDIGMITQSQFTCKYVYHMIASRSKYNVKKILNHLGLYNAKI